jgi:Sec-independent protein translocase protein TatA
VYSHNTADCTRSKGSTTSTKAVEDANKQVGSIVSAFQKSMKQITNYLAAKDNTPKQSSKKRKREKSKVKDIQESQVSENESDSS